MGVQHVGGMSLHYIYTKYCGLYLKFEVNSVAF